MWDGAWAQTGTATKRATSESATIFRSRTMCSSSFHAPGWASRPPQKKWLPSRVVPRRAGTPPDAQDACAGWRRFLAVSRRSRARRVRGISQGRRGTEGSATKSCGGGRQSEERLTEPASGYHADSPAHAVPAVKIALDLRPNPDILLPPLGQLGGLAIGQSGYREPRIAGLPGCQ